MGYFSDLLKDTFENDILPKMEDTAHRFVTDSIDSVSNAASRVVDDAFETTFGRTANNKSTYRSRNITNYSRLSTDRATTSSRETKRLEDRYQNLQDRFTQILGKCPYGKEYGYVGSEREAVSVKQKLMDLFGDYKCVRVNDLLDACNSPRSARSLTDFDFGWKDPRDINVRRVADVYVFTMNDISKLS